MYNPLERNANTTYRIGIIDNDYDSNKNSQKIFEIYFDHPMQIIVKLVSNNLCSFETYMRTMMDLTHTLGDNVDNFIWDKIINKILPLSYNAFGSRGIYLDVYTHNHEYETFMISNMFDGTNLKYYNKHFKDFSDMKTTWNDIKFYGNDLAMFSKKGKTENV